MSQDEHGSRFPWLAASLVALAAAATSIRRIYDPDIFWHIRTGEWLWRQHALPRSDPFSFTAQSAWRYSETLAELVFYAAHRAGGSAGVVLVQAALAGALALALVWFAHERARGTRIGLAASAALALLATDFRIGPKTELFSFIGLALCLALLARAERSERRRPLAYLPLLFLLWGNLHRAGTLGLFALVVTLASWLLAKKPRRLVVALSVSTAACALTLTLNSGGIGYITSGFDLLHRSSFTEYLPEWAPVKATFLLEQDPYFTLLAGVWLIAAVRRRRFDWESALALLTLALSLRSVRMVPFFAVAAVPEAARAFAALAARLEARARFAALGVVETGAAALALIAHFVVVVPASLWGFEILTWRIPVAAAAFLRDHPPPGRMWNTFEYGGYLLFAVPSERVFIDGRNDTVYSDAFFRETAAPWSPATAVPKQFEQYDIGFAFIKCTGLADPKLRWLERDSSWQLVYLDDLAAIVVKRSPNSEEYLSRWAYPELRPSDGVARAQALSTDASSAALERDIWRNLAQAPDSIRARVLAAFVARRHGNRDVYEEARAEIAALSAQRGIAVSLPPY